MRALSALDDAFAEQIKQRFATFVSNLAGNGDLGDAAARYRNGLIELKAAYGAAQAAIGAIFGNDGE